MKIVRKIAEEVEKAEKEEIRKKRKKIKKEIREMIDERNRDNKDVKTFKIRINNREIEIPEGFEVLITEEGAVIRKSSAEEVIIILKEIFELMVAIKDEGIPVDPGVVTTI